MARIKRSLCALGLVILLGTAAPGSHGAEAGKAAAPGPNASFDFDSLMEQGRQRQREAFSGGVAPAIVTPAKEDRPGDLPRIPARLQLEQAWQEGPNCGPVAVYFFLRLSGYNPPSLHDVVASMPVGAQGCSLADLQQFIHQSVGMDTAVLKVSPSEWESLPTPFIIHQAVRDRTRHRTGHFDVVARVVAGGRLDVIDTQNCVAKRVPYGVIAPEFSGYVLVSRRRSGLGLELLWLTFAVTLLVIAVLTAILVGRWVGAGLRGGRHAGSQQSR